MSSNLKNQKTVMELNLAFGRQLRHKQLKDFRKNIPSIDKLIEGTYLNLEKWFDKYQHLINFGCRSIKRIDKTKNKIILEYTNYSNSKQKLFTNHLPRRIKIDEQFLYFFGLWVGDKISGGRIGVVNKNETINKLTQKYLQKLYQKPIYVLYIGKDTPLPDVRYDKIVLIKNKLNGYAISVHVVNGILRSFFKYLESNMYSFLKLVDQPNIFFTGLFDAEGNIFLEDKCYR